MSRKRNRLFAVMLSITCIVVLTALQLQVLLSRDFSNKEEAVGPLVGKRRMQERSLSKRPRYLALTTSSSNPLYAARLAQVLQTDWVQSRSSALSAACTQTLIGDESYLDVVSIEYTIFDESVEILSRRLRKRFPDALILFIEIWTPLLLRYKTPDLMIEWGKWKEEKSSKNDGLEALSLAIFQSGPENWVLADMNRKRRDAVAKEIGNTRIVSLPPPDEIVFSSPVKMEKYLSWFQEDNQAYLSPLGHEVLAKEVQAAVPNDTTTWRSDNIGSWGSGDACNLWLSDGKLGNVAGRRVHFGTQSKHAIEFRHLRGDTITVYNPFETARMLYLTYLTALDDGVYPRTRVKLNGAPTIQIAPFHDEEHQGHLARTTAVGLIPPGKPTLVQLDPLQPSTFPFRLVGASIVSEEMRNIPIEFTLESEVLDDPDQPRFFWKIW